MVLRNACSASLRLGREPGSTPARYQARKLREFFSIAFLTHVSASASCALPRAGLARGRSWPGRIQDSARALAAVARSLRSIVGGRSASSPSMKGITYRLGSSACSVLQHASACSNCPRGAGRWLLECFPATRSCLWDPATVCPERRPAPANGTPDSPRRAAFPSLASSVAGPLRTRCSSQRHALARSCCFSAAAVAGCCAAIRLCCLPGIVSHVVQFRTRRLDVVIIAALHAAQRIPSERAEGIHGFAVSRAQLGFWQQRSACRIAPRCDRRCQPA